MDAQEFMGLMREKDELVTRLREYAYSLEEELKENRGEEASAQARAATEHAISKLAYDAGLRIGTLTLRD